MTRKAKTAAADELHFFVVGLLAVWIEQGDPRQKRILQTIDEFAARIEQEALEQKEVAP